jgi:hypothetical protein
VGGCEQFKTQCERYARGALSQQERALFEEHLATGCAACNRAVQEARAAQTTRLPWWMIVLVGGIAGVSVAWGLQARKERKELIALHAQVERALADQRRLVERAKQVALEQQAAAILSDPATAVFALQPQQPSLPVVHLYWNARFGLLLTGAKVPLPAGDRALQLWLVPRTAGAEPVSLGTFRPDAEGTIVLVVPGSLVERSALAATEISDEPASGSAQPTTILWRGTLR